MAKFKCILSGNIIEFTQQVDIDSMTGHEGYVKVEDEPVKTTPTLAAKKQVKATEVSKEAE